MRNKVIKNIYRKTIPYIRWINQFLDIEKFLLAFPRYIGFFVDLSKYKSFKDSEKTRIRDIYPQIHDKTTSTPFDSHYFYQDIWAFRKVLESKVSYHVDVGSRIIYIGILSSITHVTFIDIRPLKAKVKGLECKLGSIINLPYQDNSVISLSCLHVAEHIGLGRYGDPIDPNGTIKAANELKRVLAMGGNLYFSLPVGKPRLCFNAHRIHSPEKILEYFSDLKLMEFSGVNDKGNFVENVDASELSDQQYACGMFWFRKE